LIRGFVAVVLLLGTAVPASADTGSSSQYVDAVQSAYDRIQNASAPDVGPADRRSSGCMR